MRHIITRSRNTPLPGLALVMLITLAFAACTTPPPAEPTVTTRPSEPVATAAPAPAAEDDWSRVQKAGVIEVASPLDNQPFNMYDEQLKPDGFDVALMEELARRLGLRVKFVDVPFEGLLGALQLGQADAAIAAIAVTPDRQAIADFSQTYYIGEDAVLAAPDSAISAVESRADVVNRRVGVVRGTVYEWWLRENLIKTGEMPAANLQVYTHPDDAVRELAAGATDLVVLDREPALNYAAENLARMVGQSQYSQNFAIPVRKGSTLLPHLNDALASAKADGTVGRLIERYLDIKPEDQLPIPTPMPCTNGAGYGSPLDLTIPDGTTMQPGQTFEKRWRIVNVGACDWTAGFSFVFANKGERMGGQDAPIGAVVPIGSSYDISVPMMAPGAPGTHYGYWQMRDAKGVPFGKQVSVKIEVLGPPTATPTRTPTPQPGVSIRFWPDRYTLQPGESTTIHWDVSGVREIFFSQDGQSWTPVTGREDRSVRPDRTTTYWLKVIHYDGVTERPNFTITVAGAPPPSAPVIAQFGSDPEYEAVTGQPVTLWWDVQGKTDGVQLLRNGAQLYRGNSVHGSFTDNQLPPDSVTYEMQAWGPGGSATPARRQISVKQQPPPQPPPDITQFDYSPPGPVIQGDCVNLTWNIEGAVDGLELLANGRALPVESPGGRSFHDCECPKNVGACAYALRAWNQGGGDSAGLSVDVVMQTLPGNPASAYCVENGGRSENGMCIFPDGRQCDEWAMYRGECPIGGVEANTP